MVERRNEAVGAGFVELHEQSGAGDAPDAALESWRTDPVGDVKCAISRSLVSRSAAMARRSAAEIRAEIAFRLLSVHALRQRAVTGA
jgi:hypothetical protein